MEFHITPKYHDLFPETSQTIDEILSRVPSKAYLAGIALISAMLNQKYNDRQILDFLMRRLPRQKIEVYLKISDYAIKNQGNVTVFGHLYVNTMAINIIKYNNGLERDNTIEEDYDFIKVYFMIVSEIQKEQDSIDINKITSIKDSFNNLSWAFLVHQFQFNIKTNDLLEILKSILLIDQLLERGFRSEVEKYSERINCSILDYLSNIFAISEKKQTLKNLEFEYPSFFVNINAENQDFLSHLSLPLCSVRSENNYDVNFFALKKYPLLLHSKNTYIILNNNFLKNQIYNGFIFDFYNRSGIKNKIRSFSDYKSFIGKEIMEERLFRSILKYTFNQKHQILEFSDFDSAPDAYLRISNRIFLFEFKDYLMSSEIIFSMSPEFFRDEINLKMIRNKKGKAKGISQLIHQIGLLNQKDFDFDNLSLKKLNRKNLEIYPIILYTDLQYSIPGINAYLVSKFEELIIRENIGSFRKVQKPILISLTYFFENMDFFKTNRLDLIINNYFRKLNNLDKKVKTTLHPSDWIASRSSIEYLNPSLGRRPTKSKKEFREYFDILDITFNGE